MKHIGKSFEEHASSTFEITGDPTALGDIGNPVTVSMFPAMKLLKEIISLFKSFDGSDHEENFTKVLSFSSFWFGSAPHESLALNMN